jgi:hypothetical protein
MATLSDTLTAFLDQTDDLDGLALANAIRRLATDAAAIIPDHSAGEIPALIQRCGTALAWLNAEAKDLESRANRHGRQRAVLDLTDLLEAIHTFHAGRSDDDHLSAMRAEIAAALRPLVEAADD